MLIVSGIPVEVCRKNVKNMLLYVKPPDGRVLVTAPLDITFDKIELFVHSKTGWIKKNILKFKNIQVQSRRKYVSGETLYVWGEQYYLQIKSGKRNSIVLTGEKAVYTVRAGNTIEKREKFVRDWYKKLLKEKIETVLPQWEKKTGLKTISWQTMYMKTRWGSCKPKQRKICLNTRLAKYAPLYLEYIILHELVHFIEKGHNQRFKSHLTKYMPDWRNVKKNLNKQDME